MTGRIIGVLTTGGVGVLLVVLGTLLWKKERITLMHDYHVDKVSPENKKAFCKLSGIGLIVSGAGLVISAVLLGITDSAWSFLCFAISFPAGLGMLITAGKKYNKSDRPRQGAQLRQRRQIYALPTPSRVGLFRSL